MRFFIQVLLPAFLLLAKTGTAQQTILIKNIHIVDVEKGKLLKNKNVFISNAIITSITNPDKKTKVKADTVIDGTGNYLIPGLWDMHTHVWNDATTFPLLIANGIIGMRGMFDDIRNVNNWREKINAGTLAGPSIYSAGPIIDGPKPVWPGSVAVKDAASGRKAVDSVKNKLKVDFVKVYSLLSRESYFAIADECKKQNISFAGHVPNELTILEAANAGQKSQEHLYGFIEIASDSADYWYSYQQGKIKDSSFSTRSKRKEFLFRTYNEKNLLPVLQKIKQTNTWICPTLTVNRGIAYVNDTTLLDDPRMAYMGTFMKNFWDYRKDFRFKSWTEKDFEQSKQEFELKLKIVKLIHKAGIPILAGTDFPNPHCYIGFGLHEELEWLVKAGLTPAEALKTATIHPAQFMNTADKNGTVAVNKKANLVLLTKNPLENISHTKSIETVLLNGKVYTSAQLQMMMEAVKKMVAANVQQPSAVGFHEHEE
jgi:Amidohydrolase family